MEPVLIVLIPGLVGGLGLALLIASIRKGTPPPSCPGVFRPRHRR